jgi:hypothetical protein
VVWFFGGETAKKPHHQSCFRVSGKTSVTPHVNAVGGSGRNVKTPGNPRKREKATFKLLLDLYLIILVTVQKWGKQVNTYSF